MKQAKVRYLGEGPLDAGLFDQLPSDNLLPADYAHAPESQDREYLTGKLKLKA